MTSVRIISGAIEPIVACVVSHSSGIPVVGATDLEILIQRNSDRFFFDWDGNIFREAGTLNDIDAVLSESNADLTPGVYVLSSGSHPSGWDTSVITNPTDDDTYFVYFSQSNGISIGVPGPIEIKVDSWAADILDAVSSSQIASGVWDAARSGHNIADTFGESVRVSGSVNSGSLVDFIVNAIWDEPMNEHLLTGSTGETLFSASFGLSSASIDQIVDSVWNEQVTDHLVTGSTGDTLLSATFGTSFTQIASGVWDAARSGHNVVGSFGESVRLDFTVNSGTFDSLIDGVWDEPVREHLFTGSTGDTLLSGTAVVFVDAIVSGVWSAVTSTFNVVGTMGNLQNDIKVVSGNVDFIRAIEGGNWVISGSTMTFFEDDQPITGTSVAVFELQDADGIPAAPPVSPFRRIRQFP